MKSTVHRFSYAMVVVLALGTFGTSIASGENSFELMAGCRGLSPIRDTDWETASGMELQGRFWPSEHIGLALVGAFDAWEARTAITERDDGTTYTYTAITGDATVTSLGASLLYRRGSSGDVNLIIDLGLRYASVNSAVYAEAAYDGPGGPNYLYERIAIENTLLFVAGAALDFRVTDNVSLTLGVGYQVDLNRPEETYAGESLGKTDLGAASVMVGLVCRL